MEVVTFKFLQEVDHHYHHLHEQDQFIQALVTWTFVVWIDYLSKLHLTFQTKKHVAQTLYHLPNQKHVT